MKENEGQCRCSLPLAAGRLAPGQFRPCMHTGLHTNRATPLPTVSRAYYRFLPIFTDFYAKVGGSVRQNAQPGIALLEVRGGRRARFGQIVSVSSRVVPNWPLFLASMFAGFGFWLLASSRFGFWPFLASDNFWLLAVVGFCLFAFGFVLAFGKFWLLAFWLLAVVGFRLLAVFGFWRFGCLAFGVLAFGRVWLLASFWLLAVLGFWLLAFRFVFVCALF